MLFRTAHWRAVCCPENIFRERRPRTDREAARRDARIRQTELREESYEVAQRLIPLAEAHNKTLTQFALRGRWQTHHYLRHHRSKNMKQLDDNLGCLDCVLSDSMRKRLTGLFLR